MKNTIRRIVMAAMFASLACVATMVIRIPSPLNGYINLGDCIVLLSGWMLSPLYGFLAAGMGSALADVLSGYVVYAPATFVIKGLTALTAHFLVRTLSKKTPKLLSLGIGGALAECVMVLGYFLFEGVLYGFVPSAVNIPANIIQGVAGIALAMPLMNILKKAKHYFEYN